ncbi:MAG: 1-acyl-sn-glycerol-3-phosphate acyltransferase [Bacteroidales bacterium]|nr:1-acyl-sn-glycerol-3-phosphate acyltransferase [Bacteroidales bacterium]
MSEATHREMPPLYDQLEVEEGRYVPLDHIMYGGEDPHAHLVPFERIYEEGVDENYPYVDNSAKFKRLNWLYYFQSKTLIKFLNYFRYGFRMRGKKNITGNMDILKDGAMTVCNHVFRWDMCGVFDACGWRQLRFPIFRGQMAGKDRERMVAMGGVPIPEKLSDLRKFNAAFDYYREHGFWMHFFAEESRWDFYTPIRPFKKGAFIYAYKYKLPIIPMAYSYRKRTGILKWFGKEACVTLNVGKPILIDPEKAGNRAECIDDLRRRTHQAMVELAGIKNNPWEYNQTEK